MPLCPLTAHTFAPALAQTHFQQFRRTPFLNAIGFLLAGVLHGSQPALPSSKLRWYSAYMAIYAVVWVQTFYLNGNDWSAFTVGWLITCGFFTCGFALMQLIESTIIWPLWVKSERHRLAMGDLELGRRATLLQQHARIEPASDFNERSDDDDTGTAWTPSLSGSTEYWEQWHASRDEDRLLALASEQEAEKMKEREAELLRFISS
jgi:hypothetical protein